MRQLGTIAKDARYVGRSILSGSISKSKKGLTINGGSLSTDNSKVLKSMRRASRVAAVFEGEPILPDYVRVKNVISGAQSIRNGMVGLGTIGIEFMLLI